MVFTSAKLICVSGCSARYFLKKSEPNICHADFGRRGMPPEAFGWRIGAGPEGSNFWLGYRPKGSRFLVFRFQGFEFMVYGLGFRV